MRMRWSMLAVVLGLAGCDELALDPAVSGQEYLFDISYRSTGFFFYWVGVVVLQDGSIVAYDRDVDWPAEDSSPYSAADLEDRYASNQRVVGQVPVSELQSRLGQLMSVTPADSVPNIACSDAGMVTYGGYRYDPQTEGYTPVLVRAEGERPRQNTSMAGLKLAAWLMELARETDIEELSNFQGSFCVP